MDNFLFNVLASLTASVVVYLISKLFKKQKATLAQRVTYELNLNLYLNPKINSVYEELHSNAK